jgi:hypothetical protein
MNLKTLCEVKEGKHTKQWIVGFHVHAISRKGKPIEAGGRWGMPHAGGSMWARRDSGGWGGGSAVLKLDYTVV